MAQESSKIPVDLAVWIADVVQIQALSEAPVSAENARVIRESADRLMDVLEGRLSPELQARMTEVAQEMTRRLAA
jgi:hypothetical protein